MCSSDLGITSSIAGPAYAGIPVTHRECASSFHVFTGNFKDDERGLDFANLAALEGTLIFLMGFANLNYITQGLLAAGKAADTPAAVISQATTNRQRTAVGTLIDIEEKAAAQHLSSPAITVIGRVVECREGLNFFEPQPGRGVLILRDARQSDIFAQKLRQSGLQPVNCPVIQIVNRTDKQADAYLQRMAQYSWLVFTSPNGVKAFMEAFQAQVGDWRALGHLKFAVIGRATAQVLQNWGFTADYCPERQISDALGQGLAEQLKARNCGNVCKMCVMCLLPALPQLTALCRRPAAQQRRPKPCPRWAAGRWRLALLRLGVCSSWGLRLIYRRRSIVLMVLLR